MATSIHIHSHFPSNSIAKLRGIGEVTLRRTLESLTGSSWGSNGEPQLYPAIFLQSTPTQEDPKSTLYFAPPFFRYCRSRSIEFMVHIFLPLCAGCAVLLAVGACPIPPPPQGLSRQNGKDFGGACTTDAAIIVLGWLIKVCRRYKRRIVSLFDPSPCGSLLQRRFTLTQFT